jgi:hypothetical protein
MFIYQNTIYYSNNLNPDGTKFEYPKGSTGAHSRRRAVYRICNNGRHSER